MRVKMYKDTFKAFQSAASLEEVVLSAQAYDIPSIASMHDLVVSLARTLSEKEGYAHSKEATDLLIYVTRTRASLIQDYELNSHLLSEVGWRSVSCINSKQAVVLCCAYGPRILASEVQSVEECRRLTPLTVLIEYVADRPS